MRKSNFTLVELLTVIAIIAVLMGILLPTVSIVRTKAKKTQAKTEMQSLMTAIKMYETTYGYLPVASHATDDTAITGANYTLLIEMLSQTGPGADRGNLRGVRMLEVKKASTYTDPWDMDYLVIMDSNYDGKISTTMPAGLNEAEVTFSVLTMSNGPDKASNATASDSSNEDNIYTFETNWSSSGHKMR